MATQQRSEEHHKKSESHEEHEDHKVNKDQGNQGGGGGILSYLGLGGGGGSNTNESKQDDGDNQAGTTRSGTQYGQGRDEDYGSTGKYDTDNFGNKQSVEDNSTGGYGNAGRGTTKDGDRLDVGNNQGSNLSGNQTGRTDSPSRTEGYGNDNPSRTEGYGSQGNRGVRDRTQANRTKGYSTEGYGGRSSGERDTDYTGKHGDSSSLGRDTGYNQGSRGQSTDIDSEGRGQGYRQGTEGRTDNQGYSQGREAEFGNQQTGYGQEASRQNEPDNGVRGAPIEGDNVKGYAVSAPVGSGDTSNIDNSGDPSGQVSGAHMEYLPRESDNRDHTGRGTVGRTTGDGDSSFANVKRTIPGGTEHVVTKSSNSHIEHTSTTQM